MPRGGKREGTGRKPAFPDDEMVSVTFKLPAWLVAELAKNAKANAVTQAWVVTLALRKLFEEPAKEPEEPPT